MALLAITFQTQCNQWSQTNNEHVHADTICTLSNIRVVSNTHCFVAPTRSGELFNCKHPDYRPIYAERAVRLARIRAPSDSRKPCAPNCLKLPFTTGGVNTSPSDRALDRLRQEPGRLAFDDNQQLQRWTPLGRFSDREMVGLVAAR